MSKRIIWTTFCCQDLYHSWYFLRLADIDMNNFTSMGKAEMSLSDQSMWH